MERRIIQCNYATGTRVASLGARAYVVRANPGGGNDRILIRARSRGGRWVKKWELVSRLTNFRVCVMPPQHPMAGRELLDANSVYARALLADVMGGA